MKLLVVEDLFLMRRVIMNTLNSIGYDDLVEAEDGVDALKKMVNEKIDLVLTDWLMPNMDGLHLAKAIKKEDKLKNIPLLMITTINDKDKVLQALKCGFDDFITKPFTSEVLQGKITGIMKKFTINNSEQKKEVFYDSGISES
jgi:two-component system chemotaxis response regulator CheY